MGKSPSTKAPLKDGTRIEKSIFARVAQDGRVTAFQVKMHASGPKHSICESFDSIAEAQSFRDSVRADLALDPYKEKVLRAREEGRAAKRMAGTSLGDLLDQPVISLSTSAVRTFMRACVIPNLLTP